jgi:hypothetical protein
MGKNKKRKHQADNEEARPLSPSRHPVLPAPQQPAPQQQSIGLRAADVATTIATLNHLAAHPDLLQHKALRELRAALHPLVEAQLRRYDPIDYASRVTAALRASRGSDALLALQGMHARSQTARQGTVQRWVRDCDSIDDPGLRVRLLHAVLRAGEPISGGAGAAGAEDDEVEQQQQLQVTAAISSAASAIGKDVDVEEVEEGDEGDEGEEGDEDEEDEDEQQKGDQKANAPEPDALGGAVVTYLPPWSPGATANEEVDAWTCPQPTLRLVRDVGLRVVRTERGPERQPPNNYDLHIWACADGVGALLEDAATRQAKRRAPVRRVDVPGVPGAFVMLDVLTRSECQGMRAMAERIQFVPDHPTSRQSPSGIGGLEWLLTDGLDEKLLDRCRSYLPAQLAGGALAGINARCRFFRYTDGEKAVYRPHIDGSWPGSGLDATTGRYVHDAFGDRRSRLTFLMYLNDDFEGGCTTFYMPAAGGGLQAQGVQPRAGAVLCFPQGNTASLLHEGSAVKRGTKDVVRSDVLYRMGGGR